MAPPSPQVPHVLSGRTAPLRARIQPRSPHLPAQQMHSLSGILPNQKLLVVASVASNSATPWTPPGSSVHGILQERILEWVAVSFSRDSSWPWNQTWGLPLLHWQVDSLPLNRQGSQPEVWGTVREEENHLCPCPFVLFLITPELCFAPREANKARLWVMKTQILTSDWADSNLTSVAASSLRAASATFR